MIELSGSTLYVVEPDGRQAKFGDNLYGDIETDIFSPDETPSIIGSLKSTQSVSFEVTAQDLSRLNDLARKPFDTTKHFDIEYDVPILVQSRWHKKKRINKKWLKRYGMKSDTVKMKAKSRILVHDTQTGEFDFEIDKLEYIWRPDQLRRHLKIEM